jgi:uncharacterized protein (DUF433 family)
MVPVAIAQAHVIDRGRGPEIAGTRITVYDVLDYYKHGWSASRIACLFRLSTTEIQAAIDYIEGNKEEVIAAYARILERHRTYEYPEHVQSVIDRCRQSAERRLDEIRRRRAIEGRNAADHG